MSFLLPMSIAHANGNRPRERHRWVVLLLLASTPTSAYWLDPSERCETPKYPLYDGLKCPAPDPSRFEESVVQKAYSSSSYAEYVSNSESRPNFFDGDADAETGDGDADGDGSSSGSLGTNSADVDISSADHHLSCCSPNEIASAMYWLDTALSHEEQVLNRPIPEMNYEGNVCATAMEASFYPLMELAKILKDVVAQSLDITRELMTEIGCEYCQYGWNEKRTETAWNRRWIGQWKKEDRKRKERERRENRLRGGENGDNAEEDGVSEDSIFELGSGDEGDGGDNDMEMLSDTPEEDDDENTAVEAADDGDSDKDSENTSEKESEKDDKEENNTETWRISSSDEEETQEVYYFRLLKQVNDRLLMMVETLYEEQEQIPASDGSFLCPVFKEPVTALLKKLKPTVGKNAVVVGSRSLDGMVLEDSEKLKKMEKIEKSSSLPALEILLKAADKEMKRKKKKEKKDKKKKKKEAESSSPASEDDSGSPVSDSSSPVVAGDEKELALQDLLTPNANIPIRSLAYDPTSKNYQQFFRSRVFRPKFYRMRHATDGFVEVGELLLTSFTMALTILYQEIYLRKFAWEKLFAGIISEDDVLWGNAVVERTTWFGWVNPRRQNLGETTWVENQMNSHRNQVSLANLDLVLVDKFSWTGTNHLWWKGEDPFDANPVNANDGVFDNGGQLILLSNRTSSETVLELSSKLFLSSQPTLIVEEVVGDALEALGSECHGTAESVKCGRPWHASSLATLFAHKPNIKVVWKRHANAWHLVREVEDSDTASNADADDSEDSLKSKVASKLQNLNLKKVPLPKDLARDSGSLDETPRLQNYFKMQMNQLENSKRITGNSASTSAAGMANASGVCETGTKKKKAKKHPISSKGDDKEDDRNAGISSQNNAGSNTSPANIIVQDLRDSSSRKSKNKCPVLTRNRWFTEKVEGLFFSADDSLRGKWFDEWLKEYANWHRWGLERPDEGFVRNASTNEAEKADNNNKSIFPEPAKTMVYVCLPFSQCGGHGDRLNGLITVFLLAMASERRFELLSSNPIDLELVFSPNMIDWRVDHSKRGYSMMNTRSYFDRRAAFKRDVELLLNSKDPEIGIKSNNRLVKLIFGEECDLDVPWLFSRIMEFLFTPNVYLEQNIDYMSTELLKLPTINHQGIEEDRFKSLAKQLKVGEEAVARKSRKSKGGASSTAVGSVSEASYSNGLSSPASFFNNDFNRPFLRPAQAQFPTYISIHYRTGEIAFDPHRHSSMLQAFLQCALKIETDLGLPASTPWLLHTDNTREVPDAYFMKSADLAASFEDEEETQPNKEILDSDDDDDQEQRTVDADGEVSTDSDGAVSSETSESSRKADRKRAQNKSLQTVKSISSLLEKTSPLKQYMPWNNKVAESQSSEATQKWHFPDNTAFNVLDMQRILPKLRIPMGKGRIHIDRSDFDEAADGFQEAFAEWYMLSQSRASVLSRSFFGETASEVGRIQDAYFVTGCVKMDLSST